MSAALTTVVHVDAERGFSGGEVQVFLLMGGLRQRGWHNVLCCPPDSEASRRARGEGFDVEPVRMRNEVDVGAVLAIAGVLKRHQAVLAHLHTGRAHWLGGLAARRAGIPALATRRMDRPLRRGWRTRLLHEGLVRRTVAISSNVEGHLRAAGVDPGRLVRIHSAVDVAALRTRRSRFALRAELGASELETVFLCAGTLVHRKGQDVALRACARLAERARSDRELPPWRLWIAGEGPERADLERQARALGLGELVRFLGRRDDVPDLLQAADALLMPSRAEGLGVAALEAMAMGRPVLAARAGGLAESVQHDRSGLLFEREDAASAAQAMERVLRDPALRERLGHAGPARVAEAYSSAAMVAAYDALYRQILKERGAGAPALGAG